MISVSQARKKSTKIKFLGPETARWGGGLPREGVVAENFVPALETLSSLGFEERNPGCPGNFAGMSRTPGGVQKVRAKKVRAQVDGARCVLIERWGWECGAVLQPCSTLLVVFAGQTSNIIWDARQGMIGALRKLGELPWQTKPNKGSNMNFTHFCDFGRFPWDSLIIFFSARGGGKRESEAPGWGGSIFN